MIFKRKSPNTFDICQEYFVKLENNLTLIKQGKYKEALDAIPVDINYEESPFEVFYFLQRFECNACLGLDEEINIALKQVEEKNLFSVFSLNDQKYLVGLLYLFCKNDSLTDNHLSKFDLHWIDSVNLKKVQRIFLQVYILQ